MSGVTIVGLGGLPEIEEGADLVALIGDALVAAELGPADGDILVVTSKILSKAEGRRIAAADREDAITAETVRVVATRAYPGGVTRIVENRQGIVQAAAGVDSSNTPSGTVLLLPVDPDASARALAAGLRSRFGVRLGVIVSDTLGRAWREGQVDLAIGAAGVNVLDDLRGSRDSFGQELFVTQAAVGDELASAADLVKGKASGMPVALVRGYGHAVVDTLDTPARALSRTGEKDMFRLGTDEAIALGREEGRAEGRAAALAEAADEARALAAAREAELAEARAAALAEVRAEALAELRGDEALARENETALAAAQEAAFTEGRRAGLTEGWEAGYAEGRSAGLLDGRESGFTEGYERGLAEGWARGLDC
ncbi:coenzyme F420-0:L-glutamate ligase [Herbiconiux ginsengi]|uniref:Coenzyme F420-0:L-glutamate ligase n=1 Tax=Herbiconiux ginsengi TaxID=381665 RepID=A0A1H3S6W2_9MICO|nr:coenzyme F420-0:L-glutamate ligase [Herbiconiux ginsengi]SDZ33776.1 coenzyme F420-0:L-glutamate ligase [Herbiconiux ginsengi]